MSRTIRAMTAMTFADSMRQTASMLARGSAPASGAAATAASATFEARERSDELRRLRIS